MHYKTQCSNIGHKKGGVTMNIGERIKAARLKKGYTQEELADMVGVKKSAVAKWENGRVSEIKRSNLNMLSKALNIDPNSLLDDIEKNPVKTANEMSNIFLDAELRSMIKEYNALEESKKEQAREYIHFLYIKGRN